MNDNQVEAQLPEYDINKAIQTTGGMQRNEAPQHQVQQNQNQNQPPQQTQQQVDFQRQAEQLFGNPGGPPPQSQPQGQNFQGGMDNFQGQGQQQNFQGQGQGQQQNFQGQGQQQNFQGQGQGQQQNFGPQGQQQNFQGQGGMDNFQGQGGMDNAQDDPAAKNMLERQFTQTQQGAGQTASQGGSMMPNNDGKQQENMANFNAEFDARKAIQKTANEVGSLQNMKFQEYTAGEEEEVAAQQEIERLDSVANSREDFENITDETPVKIEKSDSAFLDTIKNLTLVFFLFVVFDLQPVKDVFQQLIKGIALNFMDVSDEFTYTSLGVRGFFLSVIFIIINKFI